MFIAQAFKFKHDFWRYLIGTVMALAGVFIGQIPLTAALFMELGVAETVTLTETQMMTVLDSNYFLFLMLLSFEVALPNSKSQLPP